MSATKRYRDLLVYIALVYGTLDLLLAHVTEYTPFAYETTPIKKTEEERIQEELLSNVSRQLDFLLHGYDKRLRPNFKGPAVKVGVNLHIASISSLSEVNMDYTTDMYLRQVWDDPRLKFTGNEEQLTIANEILNKIWWPDTFFTNAKKSMMHHTTVKNAFLRIRNDGNVYFSLRLTVTAMCNLDLTYFPMDTQKCTLEIESYGYSAADIRYYWLLENSHEVVDISSDVQMPQYKVVGHRVVEKVINLSTGNYSRLSCELYFSRSLGWYIVQIYLPTNLIVLVSWLSFWFHRDAVPARVALGITAILTITTLISNTNSSLPKISYLKSIDIYLVVCFIMVFASLLEYAAVCYMTKHTTKSTCKKKGENNGTNHDDSTGQCRENGNSNDTSRLRTEVKTEVTWSGTDYETRCTFLDKSEESRQRVMSKHYCCCKMNPSTIDKYSRILFPVTYIIFNVVYWVVFLYIGNTENMPPDVTRIVS